MRLVAAAWLVLAIPALVAQSGKGSKKPAAGNSASGATASANRMLPLPILKLTVEGNLHFPADAILAASGLKVGSTATSESFDAARQKLADLGLFDSVAYEAHPIRSPRLGYAAKFQVNEVNPLYKVQFAGFPGKNEDIEAYLRSRDPLYSGVAPPTEQIIQRWARFLDAYTASQNHPKKIIGKVVPAGPEQYIIQFQPDEPLPVVARVEFSGNDAIDSTTLQNSIGAVAYGLPFTDQNFRDFLEHQLRPLYEARGLLQVRFENVTTSPVPPPTIGLLVNLKVVEGPVFKLRKVYALGANLDVDEKDHIIRLTALKSGDVANFDAINQAAAKVNHSEQRRGYLHSVTAVERKLDESAKTVDVSLKVTLGERYHFNALTIQGLDLNGEAAVRKQWGEKPGDTFNPDYPAYFLKEIGEEGIFDHLGPTSSHAKIDEEAHTADVTLIFSPAVKKKVDNEEKRRRGERVDDDQ